MTKKRSNQREEKLVALKLPESSANYSNSDILLGKPRPAIDQLKLFSDAEFEDFTCEWLLGYRKSQYHSIQKRSGSGDLGRDVIAFLEDPATSNNAAWHNYQCKQYDHPLLPSEVRIEIGKIIYYSHQGRFSPPKKYYFIAAQGVGPKLADLLTKPSELAKEVQDNWDKNCAKKIIKGVTIALDQELLRYFSAFDFSIFEFIDPQQIIDEHAATIYHAPRFGGGLKKSRPTSQVPPVDIDSKEIQYVTHLYDAYSDHIKTNVGKRDDLSGHQVLEEHFDRQREHFYEAESLREHAKETLPDNGRYHLLLKDVYDGIIDTVSSDHSSGYECVKEVAKVAQQLNITGHPLVSELRIGDRTGMCHQLANEDRVKWVKK